MNRTRLAPSARRAATAMVLTAALATVAGCGSSRDYTVPDSLCGVSVQPDDLAPLLPDGDSIRQDRYPSEPGAPRCRVFIDDAEALRLAGDVTETTTDPFKVKQSGLLSEGHPTRTQHIGARATLTDHGALAVTDCTYQGRRKQYVVELNLATDTPEKNADRRTATLKFFRSYFTHAVQKQGCA